MVSVLHTTPTPEYNTRLLLSPKGRTGISMVLDTGNELLYHTSQQDRQMCCSGLSSWFRVGDFVHFYIHLKRGHILLEQRETAEAFQHFDKCFGLVRSLLGRGPLLLLYTLCQVLVLDWSLTSKDLVERLLAFISDMADKFDHYAASNIGALMQCSKMLMDMGPSDRITVARSFFMEQPKNWNLLQIRNILLRALHRIIGSFFAEEEQVPIRSR